MPLTRRNQTVVVYEGDFPGEAASRSATTMYTPAVAGMYRFLFYAVARSVSATGNLTFTRIWTDAQQAQSVGTSASLSAAGAMLRPTLDAVYVAAGQPIQFSTTKAAGLTGTWDMHVILEQMP